MNVLPGKQLILFRYRITNRLVCGIIGKRDDAILFDTGAIDQIQT